jgi:rhodanese-related sulfurtransferase
MNDEIISYCSSGSRSERATLIFLGYGYRNAVNFNGSIKVWSTLERPASEPKVVFHDR